MPQYDDTNRGILWSEKDKKNERSPDFTGKLDVEGKPYRLAAWIKEGRTGKFLSISISEPKQEEKPAPIDDFPDF